MYIIRFHLIWEIGLFQKLIRRFRLNCAGNRSGLPPAPPKQYLEHLEVNSKSRKFKDSNLRQRTKPAVRRQRQRWQEARKHLTNFTWLNVSVLKLWCMQNENVYRGTTVKQRVNILRFKAVGYTIFIHSGACIFNWSFRPTIIELHSVVWQWDFD